MGKRVLTVGVVGHGLHAQTNKVATCEFCESPAFKSNGKSELICENRANTGSCEGFKPRVVSNQTQRRNEVCSCGSGKKYKKCCLLTN